MDSEPKVGDRLLDENGTAFFVHAVHYDGAIEVSTSRLIMPEERKNWTLDAFAEHSRKNKL